MLLYHQRLRRIRAAEDLASKTIPSSVAEPVSSSPGARLVIRPNKRGRKKSAGDDARKALKNGSE